MKNNSAKYSSDAGSQKKSTSEELKKKFISDNGSQGNVSNQSAGNGQIMDEPEDQGAGSLKEMQYRQSLRNYNEC